MEMIRGIVQLIQGTVESLHENDLHVLAHIPYTSERQHSNLQEIPARFLAVSFAEFIYSGPHLFDCQSLLGMINHPLVSAFDFLQLFWREFGNSGFPKVIPKEIDEI